MGLTQTVLVWLIPGSAIVVWNVLREPRIGSPSDTTAGGADFAVADWIFGSSEGSGHHGGREGGGHHGFDGGHGGGGGHH